MATNKRVTKARQAAKTTALNAKYRADAAKLKAAGVLSSKVNARKNITRATRTKINKFRDVLEGRAIAVPAKPDIRRQYTEKGVLEERGRFLIAPKQYENAKAGISRGLVRVVRPLKRGQEEYVILPFKPVDMVELAERLKSDASLDGLKMPDEQFSFRLFGHDASRGFTDMQELSEFVEVKYQHLFKNTSNEEAIRFLTFQRFRAQKGRDLEANPVHSKEPKYISRKFADIRNARERKQARGTYEDQKKRRASAKKKKARSKESEEQRRIRLDEQRERQALIRKRQRETK